VPIVVFPTAPVLIRHRRGASTLSSPNLAMLYNPGQLFERELRDPRGDVCLVLEVPPAVASELLTAGRFATTETAVPPDVFLARHVLLRGLRCGTPERLWAEELALAILHATLRHPAALRTTRQTTREAHRELAEAAKDALWHTLAEDVRVGELAGRLAVSPFHLMRVFRAQTGFALHEYRLQLRLRLALERLLEGCDSLTALALELGFGSHSHLTHQFHRCFGLTPSALRAGTAHDCASVRLHGALPSVP
jgi:AraC family transcriptional regulator